MSDAYWDAYDACLAKIAAEGKTVDDVIRVCNEFYPPSSGEAFFPGGGDESVYGALFFERDDWRVVWSEADYYWCAADSSGDRLSFIEGDIERGNCRSRSNR